MPLAAIAAAIVAFLYGFGVFNDTEDVRWLGVILGLLALHFVVDLFVPDTWRRQ